MSNANQDILVEISDTDLPKLLQMYEKYKDSLPHVYSTILTGLEWRKKKKDRYMLFLSPNSCWKEDGTFFVLQTYNAFDLFCFSLDDSGKNIYEGIRKTKRLDAEDLKDKELLLYAVHNKFYPVVKKAIAEKGIQLSIEDQCHMFSIRKEEALKFDTKCPPDVYIKKLDKSYADFINSVWPHRYQDSEKFLELLIEMNDAYGIFLKSTNELVSWVLLSMLGQLGVLQTVEIYKRRGYGSLITKYMSKELALKGYNAFGTIVATNKSSISMFTKLGFRSLGIAIYSHKY